MARTLVPLAPIAFDTSSNGGLVNPGTSLTWSHTTSGNNRILFVGAFDVIGATSQIAGITYAGVSLTKITGSRVAGDRQISLWYLIAPALGANNVVITGSSSVTLDGQAVSYNGVQQSSQPDASNVNTTTVSTSIITSITTVANNCWTVLVAKDIAQDTLSAGSGSTLRVNSNGMGLFDSNGSITPPGSTSMTVADVSSTSWASAVASFSPFVRTLTNSRTLTTTRTLASARTTT